MPEYRTYNLTHWEEPEQGGKIVAKDGVVSVTPEWIYKQLQSFYPIGYQEGEIALDVPIRNLVAYWKSLGGDIEVEK